MTTPNTIEATPDAAAVKAETRAIGESEFKKKVRTVAGIVRGDAALAEKIVRMAAAAITATPGLAKLPEETLFFAVLQVANLGLDIGTMGAYLVPRKGKCSVEVSPQGLIELMMRSGFVKDVEARVVHKKDVFSIEYGSTKRLHHVPDVFAAPDEEKNPIIGAYAVITLTTGGQVIEAMGIDEILKAKASSTSPMTSDNPWNKWFSEMARKTVLKRGSKYAPKSTELRQALEIEDAQYEEVRAEAVAETPKAVGTGGTLARLQAGAAPTQPVAVVEREAVPVEVTPATPAAATEVVRYVAPIEDEEEIPLVPGLEPVAEVANTAPATPETQAKVKAACAKLRPHRKAVVNSISRSLREWDAKGEMTEGKLLECLKTATDAMAAVEQELAAAA
jgi:recombination protein RecT